MKNKKGGYANGINLVILSLIMLMLICAFIDVTTILRKTNVTSQVTGYIARLCINQGGLETQSPDFVAGNYITNDKAYDYVKRTLGSVGILEKDWVIEINSANLKNNIKTVNWSEPIDVHLKFSYDWDMLNNFLHFNTVTKNSYRHINSSQKIRIEDINTSNWQLSN